tara:strand:- start:88 stop:609 length:522 start_codon:yes stop_codon:yes gene_type:complete
MKDIENLEIQISSLNGKKYGIQEMLPNANESVNLLAKLDIFIDKLMNHLNNKYTDNERVNRLTHRLIDTKIEESPDKPGTSSYTINKGELMALCIRKKDENRDFHDYQTLLFVVIHELAHVASLTKGHNAEFLKNFKWLLAEAEESGLYYPEDYSSNPITYCGVKVTNNPHIQ